MLCAVGAPGAIAAPTAAEGEWKQLAAPDVKVLGYDAGRQGSYIVSSVADPRGGVWLGTEDRGVWYGDSRAPEGKQWRQFTTDDGLGDNNAYAMALDGRGRLWAGHQRHGVSVFNGKSWRNYGVDAGPLGERVFDIAVSPIDGDIWIATNAGLSRYRVGPDRWSHITREHGLPSVALTSLAFDGLGNLYVGTDSDGLALLHSDSDYTKWDALSSTSPSTSAHTLARVGRGEGLPSSEITDIVCGRDDAVYVATPRGLAWSRDRGDSWRWARGRDRRDKLKGLRVPLEPQSEPEIETGQSREPLLREDYISCLALDTSGLLWIGYRQRGYEIRDGALKRVLFASASDKSGDFPFVSTILPLPVEGAPAIIGHYGEGLRWSIPTRQGAPQSSPQVLASTWEAAPLPSPLAPPGLEEINGLLGQLKGALEREERGGARSVWALEDDWTTQGDWLGRYGRYWAHLGALISPRDYVWGSGPRRIEWDARIGPNATSDDAVRRWVHWLATDQKRTLEMPPTYADSRVRKGYTTPDKVRRQSELDDHGEEYPMSKDGPHLYFSLRVPAGDWLLSLYNVNKDGHDGMNRMRDYSLSLRAHPKDQPLSNISDWDTRPELARGRTRQFWGGAWKRFWVRGPQSLTVEINRNYSFNTLLAGVFLDEWNEAPPPYFRSSRIKAVAGRDEEALQVLGGLFEPAESEVEAADRLFAQLERARVKFPAWWARENRRFTAPLLRFYRAQSARARPEELAGVRARRATSAWWLRSFEEAESEQRALGLKPARDVERSLKWDGATSWSGRGREAVLRAVMGKEFDRIVAASRFPGGIAPPEPEADSKTVKPQAGR